MNWTPFDFLDYWKNKIPISNFLFFDFWMQMKHFEWKNVSFLYLNLTKKFYRVKNLGQKILVRYRCIKKCLKIFSFFNKCSTCHTSYSYQIICPTLKKGVTTWPNFYALNFFFIGAKDILEFSFLHIITKMLPNSYPKRFW